MEESVTNKILLLMVCWIVLVSGCVEKPNMSGTSNNTTVGEYSSAEIQDAVKKQTAIFSQLADAGINNSLVDVTKERVFVRYNIPDSLERNKTYYFVFGVSAKISPESENIQIEAYKSFKPFEKVSVKMKDVLDFVGGKIDFEAFKTKLSFESLA